MGKSVEKIAEEIRELADVEKLRLVDAILTDLDKPDPEIDRVWAKEARKRWALTKQARSQPSPMSPLWSNTATHESKFSHPSTWVVLNE